jgi:acetyl-CoA C-acetyltransferase
MVHWFSDMAAAETTGANDLLFSPGSPSNSLLAPVIGIMKGLTDPMVGLLMGQNRREPGAPLRHHARASRMLSQSAPTIGSPRPRTRAGWRRAAARSRRSTTATARSFPLDDGVRRDATPESLAKLRPFFDRKYGSVTPGNSSQITDGAAWMLLASEEASEEARPRADRPHRRLGMGGLDPGADGPRPVHAATPILKRHGLGLDDLDYWEINEAFAAQVLGCLRLARRKILPRGTWGRFSLGETESGKAERRRRRDRARAIRSAPRARASFLHLLKTLKRNKAKRGIACICIGGGLGGAMLVEAF